MDKLISVVIPTFNRKELTNIAIESVVSRYPDFLEIVVVDDCGTIPYSFESEVNASGISVQVVHLSGNGGAGMARKAGVARATGSYIAFLDSDDCYDSGWMDYVLTKLQTIDAQNYRLVISGVAKGERPVGAFVRKLLAVMPSGLQLLMTRLVVTIFNPLYIQATVAHKDLCNFLDGLRYCEDYYTTAGALFLADGILLPYVVACHLGREPNSIGGLSGASKAMHAGEMRVRQTMFGLDYIPFVYKLFLPIGIAYQLFRVAIKRVMSSSIFCMSADKK